MKSILSFKGKIAKAIYARKRSAFFTDFELSKAHAALDCSRNSVHKYYSHYFRHMLPKEIQEHRRYFESGNRGFGEDALHAMWFALLREYRPVNCLEIGVYRGQVLSLWALIAKNLGFKLDAVGISPFSNAGDSVSDYDADLNYYADTLEAHDKWGLRHPLLLKALSNDPEAKEMIGGRKWDLAYIDGNHDYDIAIQDYRCCRDALAPNGLLVLDDSSLGTEYTPRSFSFGGHPGPSRIAHDHASKDLKFIAAVGHNNVFQNA
jgi:hypothetical protein